MVLSQKAPDARMPRKKLRPRAPSAPCPPRSQARSTKIPGIPFLERHSIVLAVLLVAVASVRIAATYTALSVTVDEPGHLACGLQYLAMHIYRYESQHPPLARAMMAAGPYLKGVRPIGEDNRGKEGIELLARSSNPERLLALMRIGILPFFLLACGVVYYWAKHYFGNSVAAIATGLFTLLPPVLADGGLATTDMALAATLGAAFLALILWTETGSWKHSALLGITSALAALSKFTALGFLPVAAIFALLFYIWIYKPGGQKLRAFTKQRAAGFGFAVATGALVVWAGYLFSFGKIPGSRLSLPAPEFFDGIGVAMRHDAGGHTAYLLGQLGHDGWWYYFPVALAVKTPIGFLLLLAAGACLAWKYRFHGAALPGAFALGVLLPSMAGRVDIGIRHILPAYIGFSILAALAMVQLAERATGAILAGAAVLWMAVSGAVHHPDYLSYFNEFAGHEPEKILLDSNLDWGQDLKLLAKRLRELGVHEFFEYGIDAAGQYAYFQSWYGLPPVRITNPYQPQAGWHVISATVAKTMPLNAWYDHLVPTEKIGGLMLFKILPNFSPGS